MEITSTVITRTARHSTPSAQFAIEYTVIDGGLDRIQLNIFTPPASVQSLGEDTAQEQEQDTEQVPAASPQGEYLGAVYYDGHSVSCSLPWREDLAGLFTTAAGFIGQILEETPVLAAQQGSEEALNKSR